MPVGHLDAPPLSFNSAAIARAWTTPLEFGANQIAKAHEPAKQAALKREPELIFQFIDGPSIKPPHEIGFQKNHYKTLAATGKRGVRIGISERTLN